MNFPLLITLPVIIGGWEMESEVSRALMRIIKCVEACGCCIQIQGTVCSFFLLVQEKERELARLLRHHSTAGILIIHQLLGLRESLGYKVIDVSGDCYIFVNLCVCLGTPLISFLSSILISPSVILFYSAYSVSPSMCLGNVFDDLFTILYVSQPL